MKILVVVLTQLIKGLLLIPKDTGSNYRLFACKGSTLPSLQCKGNNTFT